MEDPRNVIRWGLEMSETIAFWHATRNVLANPLVIWYDELG